MPQTVRNGHHEDMTPVHDTCAYSPVPCISIGNRQRIPELAPAPPEHIYFDYLLSCISSLKYYEKEWKDTQQRASCWTQFGPLHLYLQFSMYILVSDILLLVLCDCVCCTKINKYNI